MERSCPACGTDLGSATTCPSCGATVGTDPVWECVNCGRIHQKHAPPCSRCGTPTLEQTYPEYDLPAVEEGVSYRDVLDRQYLAVVAVIGVLLAVSGLGAIGVIDLPGPEMTTGPDSLDAPGHHDTLAGHEIQRIETAWIWALNDRRETASISPVDRSASLDRIASVAAHVRVREDHRPTETLDSDAIVESETPCTERIRLYDRTVDRARLDDRRSPRSIAGDLQFGAVSGRAPRTLDASYAGVHVHVGPEGSIYVALAIC
ncbi:MAG: hypothetical protein ABEJ86_05275 [Halococcoides sp.]